MEKHEKIPILKPDDLDAFHFKNIQWLPTISQTKLLYFHINRLENNIQKLNFPIPPHRKTVHDIIYLKKGKSVRSKGLNKFEFNAGELFFLPAFQITEHQSISDNATGFFLHFDEKIFEMLPKNYLNDNFPFFNLNSSPVFSIKKETQKLIEPILNRLLTIYENNETTEINLIAFYLLSFLAEIKKENKTISKKTKSTFLQITHDFKNALAQYIYKKQSLTEYADLLHISPNYLNKCVKISTNKTAQDLLNEMLILEAKTLLKYSKLQIAEIAVYLCNQTPSNFSRFFKNQTGVTPKEYIKMIDFE